MHAGTAGHRRECMYEASLLDDASKKYVPNGAFSTAHINHSVANVASTDSW